MKLFAKLSLSSLGTLGLMGALLGCGDASKDITTLEAPLEASATGIRPNIVIGDTPSEEQEALQHWIAESIELFQSPEFETNFKRASQIYPRLYVSKTQDIIPSQKVLDRLKTQDPLQPNLWWPKTYVILRGSPAVRAKDQSEFGFEGNRKAAAGPFPAGASDTATGEIELGRLHLARYTQGDAVEKSCAINTMVHEISHTLSDKADRYWMHILDSEPHVTPPYGVYEASYFIGVVAQCTYLQSAGRVSEAGFPTCLLTFSNPANGSRFKSRACDDFPEGSPITPF